MDIFIQTLRGLKHIHDKGYVHRDIKPENLLVTQDLRIKISDAGISDRCNLIEEDTTQLGSLNYIGPEMVSNKTYTKSVDIWSIGCILYEICTMFPAFTGAKMQLKERILDK